MNETDALYWAQVAAEELSRALDMHGIRFHAVQGDRDGDVNVAFVHLADAEAMMTLAIQSDEVVGGLYDRSTASCLTLSHLADIESEEDTLYETAIRKGWKWTVHPAMHGRRMSWHVSADIPAADANTITANLNALRNGGVL